LTVAGCLRAGLAEDTFVVTTATDPDSGKPATYQLIGHAVPLRDYVGQQVNVSGTLRAEEQVATKGTTAVDTPATGTAGTPVVRTNTELDVKELSVNSIAPTGQSCSPQLPSESQPARRIK